MANVSSSNGLEKRPKLRFPGFEEPWKDTFFSDLYEAVSEKNDGSFGVENIISVANMYFKEDARITDEEYLKTYNIFKVGDIAFEGNKSNDFSHGRFVENTIGDGIVSHVFVVFRPLHDTHNLRYWKYAINNESVMGRILARCTKKTTMMTNLVTKDFLNQTILCPSAQEQDKIANLLDGISERIKLQKLYVESLKKYKRGAVQKLFSEMDMKQWELVRLKDVVNIFDGTHQTPNYKTTGVRFISVENILNPLATQKYISEDDYKKEFKVHPEYGDVLMTRIGDIGRTCYVNFDSDIAYYVSLALFKCSSKIDGRFLAAYISTNTFQKELWERTLHIAFPKKINTGEIGECHIRLPSRERQIVIASYLDVIEKKIQLAEKQLNLMQLIKIGLIQQLFI